MLNNLSRREKSMLYGLLLFALAAAVVYFILLPGLARNAALRADIDALLLVAAQRDAVRAQADAQRGRRAALEADIAALETGLLPAMAAHEADRLVTGLIEAAGLTPASLAVGGAETAALPPFVPADFALSAYAAHDRAAFTAAPADVPPAICRTVEVTATGTLAHLAALLDAVAQADGLALATVSYSTPEEGAYAFALSFALYSYA